MSEAKGLKYKITNEEYYDPDGNPTGLYRIQALRNFGEVKAGDLGGFIEKETNLSQMGSCWIDDKSIVSQNAMVVDDAIVISSYIGGDAFIKDCATVISSNVTGEATIGGKAKLYSATICDNVLVTDEAEVHHALLKDNVSVRNNASIVGMVRIGGSIQFYRNAEIRCSSDYMQISPVGLWNQTMSIYKAADGYRTATDKGYKECGLPEKFETKQDVLEYLEKMYL